MSVTNFCRNVFPSPHLISTTRELEEALTPFYQESYITVDTEFIRGQTYWPQLCLVQIAGEKSVVLIDTQADGINLTPLADLLFAPHVLKVFHAARQDLEIFLRLFQRLPTPVFDTQIAAMVTGFGEQVGYDALVKSLLGVFVDKSQRFTDWSARPLSEAQLFYAAGDVTWLRLVYEKLRETLEHKGRLTWIASEMAELEKVETFIQDPERQWERLRVRGGNRRTLGVLRAIAALREREAQRLNVPRQHLIRDESLLEIAATLPKTREALARVRGISRISKNYEHIERDLLDAVHEVLALPEAELPCLPKRHSQETLKEISPRVAMLKVLLMICCERHGVAPTLVASQEDLEILALNPDCAPSIFTKWRYHIFGQEAAALCKGQVALTMRDSQIIRLPINDSERV